LNSYSLLNSYAELDQYFNEEEKKILDKYPLEQRPTARENPLENGIFQYPGLALTLTWNEVKELMSKASIEQLHEWAQHLDRVKSMNLGTPQNRGYTIDDLLQQLIARHWISQNPDCRYDTGYEMYKIHAKKHARGASLQPIGEDDFTHLKMSQSVLHLVNFINEYSCTNIYQEWASFTASHETVPKNYGKASIHDLTCFKKWLETKHFEEIVETWKQMNASVLEMNFPEGDPVAQLQRIRSYIEKFIYKFDNKCYGYGLHWHLQSKFMWPWKQTLAKEQTGPTLINLSGEWVYEVTNEAVHKGCRSYPTKTFSLKSYGTYAKALQAAKRYSY